MGNILDLLSVSATFFKCFDKKWGSGWEDSYGTLSVLDSDLDLNFNSSIVLGGLLNIFTDFLWGKTDWTTLRSESSGGSNFATNDLPSLPTAAAHSTKLRQLSEC